MDDIAKAADVSKGTLYNYFTSKAHLFAYLLENGMPGESAATSIPAMGAVKSERELLSQLRKQLKKESRLGSVEKFLKRKPEEVDLESELHEIMSEWWDLLERNRVQIMLLERSAIEFPEMARIYDLYARERVLQKVEKYLSVRISQGVMRPLASVAGMARMLMTTMSMFGWRQFMRYGKVRYHKSEILPDMVSTLVHGWKRGRNQEVQ
jgi:AcrR family transcriptional regulator